MRIAGVEGEKCAKGETERVVGTRPRWWIGVEGVGAGEGEEEMEGVDEVARGVWAAGLRGDDRRRRGEGEYRTVFGEEGAVFTGEDAAVPAGDGESGPVLLALRRVEGVSFSFCSLGGCTFFRTVMGVPSGIRGVESWALRSEGDLSRRERAKAEGVRGGKRVLFAAAVHSQ